MPRDANGNYSLPAGNPVVTGTLIQSVWANDTMSDLANEMQDSLSRSGKGGFTAPVGIVDGTGAVPGLHFITEQTSGFKRESAGDIRIQVLGADNIRFLAANRATDVWNNDLTTPAWERVFTTPIPNVLDADVEKTLQIKRETTPAVVPSSTAAGELGVNIGDDPPTLYVGDGTTAKPFIGSEFIRFPSGTKMLLYQDTAPLGWQIDQAVDEHMVRLTKGSVNLGQLGGVSGGSYDFSTVFADLAENDPSGAGVGGHGINEAETGVHSHADSGHTHGLRFRSGGAVGNLTPTRYLAAADQSGDGLGENLTDQTNTVIIGTSTASLSDSGSGADHYHSLDLKAKWAACIIVTKD